jgi:hypothetical protein
MAFMVFRNGQEPAEEFGDKDRLEIIEGGVLKTAGRTARTATSTRHAGSASMRRHQVLRARR